MLTQIDNPSETEFFCLMYGEKFPEIVSPISAIEETDSEIIIYDYNEEYFYSKKEIKFWEIRPTNVK